MSVVDDIQAPIVNVVGRSGAGKTTFLEGLLSALGALGLRVAVIKHGHGFELDRPGKDSWRLARAGAISVIVSSPCQLALLEDLKAEWPLERLAALVHGRADLVLTEGYKASQQHLKIEVARPDLGPPLCPAEDLWALVSDVAIPGFERVRRFVSDATAQVGSLLAGELGLGRVEQDRSASETKRIFEPHDDARRAAPKLRSSTSVRPPKGSRRSMARGDDWVAMGKLRREPLG